MSQARTRVPDPDTDEIARRAAEIRKKRKDGSPESSQSNPSRRMLKAIQGASFMRWRFRELEDVDR